MEFCLKNVRQNQGSMAESGALNFPLIIATRNAHKTMEIRQMLGDRCTVLDASDFPDWPEVAETGTTFLENATLKAETISARVSGLVLADDSGLMVDALHGAPGVYSSSYGGQEGNHAMNNQKLLAEMRGVPAENRTARFVCTMVLAREGKFLAHFCGEVEGRILSAPGGAGGFGYDPFFAPSGYDQSFAELGSEVKNTLSHRGRALAKVIAWLEHQSLISSP
jgi:XTP/dITP diphosphohydrolase